ncbi:MAG: alpha/beta fold hydrolase [Desulfobacterales bacterium]|jgi:alpha-beta hydrolase superfamily lysophospholipase
MNILPQNLKKLMFRIPVYYLIVVLGMSLLQNFFIYYPKKTDPKLIEQSAENRNLRLWPDNVNTYRGFVSTDASQKSRGTILVFHGNAGNALDRTYYVSALNRLGYRVILSEYPAYGSRPGKTSEKEITADAVQSIRLASLEFGPPIYLLGESLGCGVVCGAVAKSRTSIDGIALITPWDSLTHLARIKYWFFPVKWMLKDSYDNVTNLLNYQGPVAVVMAGQDEIIPNPLTRRLYDSLRQPKRLWIFAQAGHNSWPSGPHEPWWEEMMNFLQSTKAGNETSKPQQKH